MPAGLSARAAGVFVVSICVDMKWLLMTCQPVRLMLRCAGLNTFGDSTGVSGLSTALRRCTVDMRLQRVS